jgi:uncharacterized protein YndB with AHSA1/START domain/DNA-binding transcriptional ArsR family regulator
MLRAWATPIGRSGTMSFKALADVSRRTLLDLLFERDGQTLSELQAHLPMTRFGTMKHLQVLEDAGLITTRKVGREKLHYLNPVPIQLVYDRWVSKYARGWTRTLTGLKYALEETGMTGKQAHVFEIFVRTTPERLWQALTDGDLTRQYYYNTRIESDWTPGSPYTLRDDGGTAVIDGEVLEIDPPRRLVTTFRAAWSQGAPSTVTWEIVPEGEVCKLTLTHEGIDPASQLGLSVRDGWARILSGLKTLLETGRPLSITG